MEQLPPDRVLTIPNALSVLRLLGVPLFLWLVLGPHADGLALLVLVLSGFTDYLDGVIARRFNQTSRLGQLLDPTADRLYILATVIGLAGRDIIPLWLAIALPLRDVLLAPMLPMLRRRGLGPPPVHYLGKAATFCLLYAFPLLLLSAGNNTAAAIAHPLAWAFTIWGTALYWWAGLLYARQVRRVVRSPVAQA
ncbi:MAG: CDP-alcohol phosphatidyltransferase family protein [Frankiaceae bacterium]